MEGPSLVLAKEQLRPFKGKTVLAVSGNTKIGKERFVGQKVRDIFSWGKHLVFQFDGVALRFHFMLFGTFAETTILAELIVRANAPSVNVNVDVPALVK